MTSFTTGDRAVDAHLGGYRRDIDGLRALAVVPVLLFHAGVAGFAGGYVGVDVFFVISGYLITGIVARECQTRTFSILTFYERRIRRIFPALFAMLAAVGIASTILFMPMQFVDFGESLGATALFWSNFYFRAAGGYFGGPSELKPLLHTWSLSVEEQFYIFFPLFLALSYRLFRAKWVLMLTVLVALCSLALSIWGTRHHPTAAFYLAPARACELLLGSVLSLGALAPIRSQRVRDLCSVFGLVVIAFCVVAYSDTTPFPAYYAMIPCVGAGLILHAGAEGASLGGRLLGTRPLVFIGLISYSLYLWHWPVIVFFKYWVIRPLNQAEVFACVALSLVLGILSWRFVEHPFRPRDAVFRRPGLFAAAGLGMALCVAIGAYISAIEGAPARLIPALQALGKLDQGNAIDCLPTLLRRHDCVMGSDRASAPSFVVWGDSHAEALFAALSTVAQSKQRSGLFFSRPGCPPLADTRKEEPRSSADNDACSVENARALSALADVQIQDVILVARWPYYFSGHGFGVDAANRISLFDAQGSHRLSAQELERRLERTIERLLSAGKHVHFVETTPEFSVGGADGYGRVIQYGRSLTMLDEKQRQVEARHEHARRVVTEFAHDPRFHFVPTHDLFCHAGVCRPYSERGPLYWDNNHVGERATPLLAARLASVFL